MDRSEDVETHREYRRLVAQSLYGLRAPAIYYAARREVKWTAGTVFAEPDVDNDVEMQIHSLNSPSVPPSTQR